VGGGGGGGLEVHVTKVFDLVGCEMLGHDLWKMPMRWGCAGGGEGWRRRRKGA
jgi:hypothetical protein